MKSITLLRRRYAIHFVKKMRTYRCKECDTVIEPEGLCDSPDTKRKAITIIEFARGQRELEIWIHEMLHACCWYLGEEFVGQFARDVARVLWKRGWRRINDDQKTTSV